MTLKVMRIQNDILDDYVLSLNLRVLTLSKNVLAFFLIGTRNMYVNLFHYTLAFILAIYRTIRYGHGYMYIQGTYRLKF